MLHRRHHRCRHAGRRTPEGHPGIAKSNPDLQYAGRFPVIQRTKHETDTAFAAAQVRRYVEGGKVEATDGSLIALDAESLCIHGDGPNATAVGDAVRSALTALGCSIAPVMV